MTTNKKRPKDIVMAEDYWSYQKSAGWGTTAVKTSLKEIFEQIKFLDDKSVTANDNQ